jgi:hypothetical protein
MGCFSLFVGLITRHSLSSALIEVEKFDFTNDDMPTSCEFKEGKYAGENGTMMKTF